MEKSTIRKSAKAPVETDNISSSIIQLVHDAIIVVDEDQNIFLFNQGAEKTFGYKASEVIGQRLDLLLPPQVSDFHAVYVRSFAKSLDQRRLMGERKEISGRRKDGAIFPAEASIAKVSIGERTFFTAIFRDITEQVRKEEETRLQLTLTRAIAEADNFDSALSIAIKMICEITGWDFGEVWLPARDGLYLEPGKSYYCKGKKLEKFRTVSERFKFESNIGLPGRVLASRKAVWIPDVTTTEDFERAAYAREAGLKAAVGIPILAGKEVVAVMNFFLKEARPEDKNMVTLISTVAAELGMVFARRQTGQKLRESEEAQRMVLNGIDEIVYQVRFSADHPVEGVVEFVSERVQETLGHRPGEFITDPQRWFSLIHPEDIPIVQDQTKKIIASGLPAVREYRIKDINEEYRWLEDRVVLQKDKKSRVTKMFGVARDVTERKRAEQTIKKSEVFSRAVLDSLPAHIAVLDAQGMIIAVNKAWENFARTNNGNQQIIRPIGANYLAVVENSIQNGDETAQVALDGIRAVINGTQEAFDMEYPCHSPEEQRWFVMRVRPLKNGNLGVVVSHQTITERRRADEKLRQSEEKFRGLTESLPIGISITTPKGEVIEANSALVKMTGYDSKEEFLQAPASVHYYKPEDRERFVKQLLEQGAVAGFEVQIKRKDGTIFWCSATSITQKNPDGTIFLVHSLEDITERKQAEKALRESEKQYRDLFESTSDLIQAVAPDGRLLFANRAWREALGYTEQELINLNIDRVVHPEALTQCFETLQRAMSGGQVDRIETRFVTKEEKSIIVEGSVACRFEASQPMAITCFLRDITAHKLAEAETQLLLALTKAVAEAESFDSALTLALSLVCRHTGWDFGEVWIPSHDGTHLELGSPYYGMESFQSVSKGFEFAPGIGLPGRVWASGKPIWIPDVTLDANFPRTALAEEAGFKAAVGIPILADDIVVAVIDFFLREARQEDERMVALVSAVAAQLGTTFQRKQSEEALHRSEATLSRAQEVGHIGSWIVDLQRNAIIWSAETYRIYGVPPGTPLTYETFLACIHPEDQEHVDRSWREALAGAPYDIEHRIVVGEEVKWVHERAELQFDAEGAPLNSIGTVQDITERRRAEEALRKKDEHHRAVIESIFKFVPEGVLVLTESLNLLKHNKAFDDILQKYAPRLGYAEQELADEIIQQLRSKILGGENTEIRVPKKSK